MNFIVHSPSVKFNINITYNKLCDNFNLKACIVAPQLSWLSVNVTTCITVTVTGVGGQWSVIPLAVYIQSSS